MLKEDSVWSWKRIATGRQRNFLRMEPTMFDELLHKITPRLAKQNIWYEEAIGPGLRMTAVQGVQDI